MGKKRLTKLTSILLLIIALTTVIVINGGGDDPDPIGSNNPVTQTYII